MSTLLPQGRPEDGVTPLAPNSFVHQDGCLYVAIPRSHLRISSHHPESVFVPFWSVGTLVGCVPGLTSSATCLPPAQIKHRRTEVVCTNCRAASKKCSDSRPCIRCKERGLQDSCADASCNRKKRKREDSQCHEPVQVEQQSHDEKSKVDALWGFPMRLRNVQGEWGQPGSSTQTVFATESTLPPQMNVSVGSAHQSDFAHGSQWMAQSSNGYMSGFSGPAQLQPEGHQWQGNLTSGPMFNAGLFNQPSSSRY